MKKENLEKARLIIMKSLNDSDIMNLDKMELLINLNTLFDNYEVAIKILRKELMR